MGRIRQLASDTAIYGLTTVVSRLLTYFLVPFYTKYFGTGEYGVITLVFIAIGFFNVLFTFGMESAYLRYGIDRDRAASLFKTLQITILGVGSVLVLLLWSAAPLVQPVVALEGGYLDPIYLFMLAILWLDALATVPFAELRLVRRTYAYAGAKLLNVAINVALNLYLVLSLGMGIVSVLIANVVASGWTLLHTAWLTRKSYNGSWDGPALRTALSFGLPYIPAGIGYIINEGISRVFLNITPDSTMAALYGSQYTSADITGIFGACYKLSVFMMLLTQMFRMAWQPFFMKYAQAEDAPKTFADVFRYYNFVAAGVFLTVGLFVAEIAAIPIPGLRGTVIDSRYWLGLSAVPMLLAAYWFQGWYTNFTAGVFIREKTKILPKITLAGATITILANIVLIPKFGMEGAAWASVMSYGSMALMIYRESQKQFPIPYRMASAFLVMAASGLMVAATAFEPWLASFYGKLALLASGLVMAGAITFWPRKN